VPAAARLVYPHAAPGHRAIDKAGEQVSLVSSGPAGAFAVATLLEHVLGGLVLLLGQDGGVGPGDWVAVRHGTLALPTFGLVLAEDRAAGEDAEDVSASPAAGLPQERDAVTNQLVHDAVHAHPVFAPTEDQSDGVGCLLDDAEP